MPHNQSLVLANGSFAVTFTPEDVAGRRTLFSKDAKGFGAGGHLAAFVRDSRIEVQLQNTKDTVTLKTEPGSIRAGEDYSLVVTFGADGFRVYLDGELAAWRPDVVTGLDKNTQNLVLGANTWLRDQRNPSWTGDYFVGTMEDFNIYGRALSRAEVALIGAPHDLPGPTQGTSNSGLDRLVDIIYADPGLYRNVPAQEIADGAANADAMNRLIVEAIKATGVANDHMLNAADLRDVNAYLRANYAAKWITLHGDDEDSAETGFHLVQNDGATTYLFGDENAVNTVADGIYHLGFEIRCERLLNEDGNENATLKDVAFWLNKLLAKDLTGKTLVNTKVDLVAEKTTGTGLDQLVETIVVDPGLNRNLPTSEIVMGARICRRDERDHRPSRFGRRVWRTTGESARPTCATSMLIFGRTAQTAGWCFTGTTRTTVRPVFTSSRTTARRHSCLAMRTLSTRWPTASITSASRSPTAAC